MGPALVVGLLASALAYRSARVDVRVTGVVSLSVLAGNQYAYKLNAYTSDFYAALASPQVARAVDEAVGRSSHVSGIRADRNDDASDVRLSLTAAGQDNGRAALLAAGQTALRLLAEDRRQELLEEHAAVRRRLAQQPGVAGQPAGTVNVGPIDAVGAARERAANRALQDLGEVEGDLAVVDQLLSSVPVPGVRVSRVVPLNPLLRGLRTSIVSGLGAALIGSMVLYSRRAGALRQSSEPHPTTPGAGVPRRRRTDAGHVPGGAVTANDVPASA